eukprot:2248363-Rhodomonas_salina.1
MRCTALRVVRRRLRRTISSTHPSMRCACSQRAPSSLSVSHRTQSKSNAGQRLLEDMQTHRRADKDSFAETQRQIHRETHGHKTHRATPRDRDTEPDRHKTEKHTQT